MSGHEAYCALHKGYFPANEPCPYCLELRERKRDMPNDLGSQVYKSQIFMAVVNSFAARIPAREVRRCA